MVEDHLARFPKAEQRNSMVKQQVQADLTRQEERRKQMKKMAPAQGDGKQSRVVLKQEK